LSSSWSDLGRRRRRIPVVVTIVESNVVHDPDLVVLQWLDWW
jgi:hypothetical protein